jgi:hypothetical protein
MPPSTNQNNSLPALRQLLSDISDFSRGLFPRQKLRDYQIAAAQPILSAIRAGRGGQFAILFSRQAGKDEMLAQLECYLLNLFRLQGGQIIVAAPTQRQANISRDRLASRLNNLLNIGQFSQSDYKLKLGQADARFLSAAPTSNARGETASLLLLANEAQDILPERWDAVFEPMGASTNAVTVFCGTPWTSHTLLARQIRFLRELEAKDNQPRVFLADWQRVAASNPAYGERVKQRIAQFGEDHPFVKTEYRLLEIDGDGGLLPTWRQQLMHGSHQRQERPTPGKVYCLLIDVAGSEETEQDLAAAFDSGSTSAVSKRDSTAITVVEVAWGEDNRQGLPVYKVVHRYIWTNVPQSQLYGRILSLAKEQWQARYVVIDATGIGAGLASFLSKSLSRKLIPFVFGAVSKSQLGWGWLAAIDSGRYLEYLADGQPDTALFWQQCNECIYEVRPGPGKLIKWSVPSPTTHDDLLTSAALVAVLDEQNWQRRSAIGIE